MPMDTAEMSDEMSDAFYSSPDEPKETETDTEKTPESVDEENAESPTALIPTSALGGKAKPGDTVTLRIVKVHDGEAEVEITSGKTSKPETKTADEELDMMAAGKY